MAFGRPTHYYQDATGERIPGVTTILGSGLPKPALVNWAGNTTAAYAVDNWDDLNGLGISERLERLKKCRYEDRDAAAKRGTEVHALAERLIKGEAVTVPDELKGHVESYVAFLDDWHIEPTHVEITVVNYTVGYAGTLDLIGRLPDETVTLADIKTTRSGIFGEVALQLAAYRYAEKYLTADGGEADMPEVDETHAIWVRADGYSVYPMDTSRAVFDDFRRVYQVARLMDRLGSYKGEEVAR